MRIKHPQGKVMCSVDDAVKDIFKPEGPTVTSELIDGKIKKAECLVFPGTTITICNLTLENGFSVIGTSACACKENFNQKIGQELAIEKARDKVWELEGYLLKEQLFNNKGSKNGQQEI